MPSAKVSQQTRGFDIEHPMVNPTGLMAKSLDEVTFAYTYRPDKDCPLLTFDKLTGGQIHDLSHWYLGVEGKVEALEGLQFLEVGLSHSSRQPFISSPLYFVLQEHLQERGVPQVLLLSLPES